jgi:hypothetical protein
VEINGQLYRDTLSLRVAPGETVGAVLDLGAFKCDDD